MAQRPRTFMTLQQLEDRTTPTLFVPGQVLVGFTPGSEQQGMASVSDPLVVAGSQSLGFGIYKLTLQPGTTVEGSIGRLSGRPGVAFVEPNYLVQPTATPNDPKFLDGSLWGMRNTGQNGGTAGADTRAFAGWDIGSGNGNTVVAVIDFGIEYTHPDLAANMWTNPGEVPGNSVDDDGNGFVDDVHGFDFSRNTGDILGGINDSHGTHVAGTIGAVGNNGVGVTGMAWKTRLMTVPLFSSGANSGQISVAIQGLNYAVMMGSKLSNHSWGYQGPASAALQLAITTAGAQGHVFVAAAGNSSADNDTNDFFPTNYYGMPGITNVVSVAAFDRNDQLANFSNFGSTKVTLGAPGVEILSTGLSGGYEELQGTSMAAPHVCGALAAFMDSTPGATPLDVVNALKQSVRKTAAADGNTDTDGVLDMDGLMQLSGSGLFATGADAGGGPHVKVYVGAGREVASFFAYNAAFKGGVRVATGDVNGDRFADIITTAGPGGGPHVKVFDGQTFKELYSFFAFEATFTGGLTVAAGDVNGDGKADIIVGADRGGGPRVSVFSKLTGVSGLSRIANFFAYEPNFTGGVNVAAGLFTPASKVADVITAPGRGGGPHVRRFAVSGGNATVVAETMVGDPNSRTGLFVSAGDLNADKVAEIITGSASGNPFVNITDGATFAPITTLRNPAGGELPGLLNPADPLFIGSKTLPTFPNGLLPPATAPNELPFDGNQVKPGASAGYSFGVRVGTMDVNGDKVPELLLAGGPSDAPIVSIMNGATLTPIRMFAAYDPTFFGGVFVGGTLA